MNYNTFTQKVDALMEQMTKEELIDCFHNVARKTPENNRVNFLAMIQDYSNKGEKTDSNKRYNLKNLMNDNEVKEKLAKIKETFRKLEEEELCLSVHGYEDYSSGYWSDNWIYEYEDHEGIGNFLDDTTIFARDCINDFRYKEAVEIFDLIMNCVVWAVDEDGGDNFELELEELINENIFNVNLQALALDVLYSNYQMKNGEQRLNDFYQFFSYGYFRDISIEDIFSRGREELKDVEKFGEDWITFLMEKEGDIASRLLKEAVSYHRGIDGLVENARTAYKKHPSMYLEVLLEFEKNHEYQRMQEVGIEALDKIDRNLKIRAEIALKTAQASQCIQDMQTMSKCWFEAFHSDATVANYLRLYVDSSVTKKYAGLAEKRIETLNTSKECYYENLKSNLDKNVISEHTKKEFEFFLGNFDKIKSYCEGIKGALGWSGSFIGDGLDLMLLYLLSSESLGKACKSISQRTSSGLGFSKPNNLIFFRENWIFENDIVESKNKDIFWNVFNKWKQNYPMSIEEINENLNWIEPIINKRVEAIVGGQYRRRYGDVALLIAAFGEVREANGVIMAKQSIIEKYKKKFPRHSSFHGALREYI
jgi:hypothetical protein